jgi:hypothetical protein
LVKYQSKATVEGREASSAFSSEASPELQTTKTWSTWKSADAHRGEPKLDPGSDDMMRFTATGRRFVVENHYQSTWAASEDALYGVAGKTLPWKYTDDSLISVPCHRPRTQESVPPLEEANVKKRKKWWRRTSSMSKTRANDPYYDFVLKEMRRGDYLKQYAQDERGNYIGTEEPAEDCMLRGEDLEKYRGGEDKKFRNEIVKDETDRSALIGVEYGEMFSA